jgi:hypothetical protein
MNKDERYARIDREDGRKHTEGNTRTREAESGRHERPYKERYRISTMADEDRGGLDALAMRKHRVSVVTGCEVQNELRKVQCMYM